MSDRIIQMPEDVWHVPRLLLAGLTKTFLNLNPFLVGLVTEDWADEVLSVSGWAKFWELLYAPLGPALLFLLLLTIRNRYRL